MLHLRNLVACDDNRCIEFFENALGCSSQPRAEKPGPARCGNAAGEPVRIYMRPEDRHVEGDIAGFPNRLRGRITHIDYLGTFCLAELRSDALGQPMLISYSLNQMHDLGVREGVEVDIALRVDRVRVFSDSTAKRAAG